MHTIFENAGIKHNPEANVLVVKEWKTGDKVVKAIESRGHQVLGVVAEELKGGKHGKAAVLELVQLALLKLSGIKGWLASVEVSKEAVVVDGTDEEEHLGPAKSGDGVDGGNTVRDISESKAGGDLSGEGEDLRDDVSDDAKLGNTSVLEFGDTVGIEGLLIDVGGQSQGVEVAGGGDHCKLKQNL